MGATQSSGGISFGRGLEVIGILLLVALAGYLVLDFLAKLAFFRLTIGGVGILGGELPMSRLVTLAWDGIVIGLGLGLAGIGLSMTYSILGFANFSHGDYITSGGFAGWSVTFLITGLVGGESVVSYLLSLAGGGSVPGQMGSLGYLLSVGFGSGPSPAQLSISVTNTPVAILVGLGVAIVATLVLSLVLDRLVYRPMREQGAIALLIASIGVALALRYTIVFAFGGQNRGLTAGGGGKFVLGGESGRPFVELTAPSAEGTATLFRLELPVAVGNYTADVLSVTSHEATLVVVAVLLMGGLHLMLQRTKLGTAMRAMADNKDLARVTGIPTERVIRATWIIGGGLAGASGYLIALERGTLGFNLGWLLLLLIFAAVILGGIGSVYGAMAGGIVIGLASTVSLIWIPSSFATAAAFSIMILMLLFRPEGLFGGVTTA